MKRFLMIGCLCALAVECGLAQGASLASGSAADTRYGLFDWLDRRSEYGQGVFPEPFLVDDSDLEPNESRLDWLHTEAAGAQSDAGKVEIEHAFGLMTWEFEVPYESDRADDGTTEGFGNIDVGARYPVFQYVSPNGLVDSTFGVGLEVGIPTDSSVSKNAELVPKAFNDLKAGNFTVQSIAGYSTLFGPGDDGGLQMFEYGFVFGYTVPRRRLPLPGVLETIPVFELVGQTELNKAQSGQTRLLGDAGLRLNLKAIGPVQPRPGIVFVFPLDSGAREDTHWGVMISLVFQY